jgi:hypothetical protein
MALAATKLQSVSVSRVAQQLGGALLFIGMCVEYIKAATACSSFSVTDAAVLMHLRVSFVTCISLRPMPACSRTHAFSGNPQLPPACMCTGTCPP